MELNGLSAQIAEYIVRRAEAKLEKFDKEAVKQSQAANNELAAARLEAEHNSGRSELDSKYEPANWLTDAAQRAKQIQMVTHALKYTHPDARGSSLYAPGDPLEMGGVEKGLLVTTASLNKPVIDAVGNAAALDVAALLQLAHDGKTLISHIEQGDSSPLRPFARSEEQLGEWLAGFRMVLEGNEASSHKYAKQLYFPIDGGEYHLLAPLYSSSLAHTVNSRIAASRYPEGAKEVRKAKREGRYHAEPVIDFPDTAIRSFGGTKPQNVSQLNSSQGGKAFLLSSAPPEWGALAKPPLGSKTVFSRYHFGWRAGREVRLLKQYLELVLEKSSTKPIRDCRAEYVEQIIDKLVLYIAEIQNLPVEAGWSASPECKLFRAEQLWLDPKRKDTDEAFALELEKGDWQEEVADSFARWLNNRLKSDKLQMGDREHAEWKGLAMEVID